MCNLYVHFYLAVEAGFQRISDIFVVPRCPKSSHQTLLSQVLCSGFVHRWPPEQLKAMGFRYFQVASSARISPHQPASALINPQPASTRKVPCKCSPRTPRQELTR